jgi:hypothetical protein
MTASRFALVALLMAPAGSCRWLPRAPRRCRKRWHWPVARIQCYRPKMPLSVPRGLRTDRPKPPSRRRCPVTMKRVAARSGRSQRDGRGTQRVSRSTPGMEPVTSRTWPGGQLPSSTRTIRPVGKRPVGGAQFSTSGSAQAKTRPHEIRSTTRSVFITQNVSSKKSSCNVTYV